jgi:hypothetical protein
MGSGSPSTGRRERADGSDFGQGYSSPPPDPHLKVAIPMEIVVACGPDGVVLHPGGYPLSQAALRTQDGLLERHLRAIVHHRQQVDPMIRPVPSIRFLVEAGGGMTYVEARRQVVLSGLDWPTSLRVADTNVRGVFPKESW